jgi:hypothetical protein
MMNDDAKTALDIAAGANAALALMQWLPPLAALLTIIWTAIRIYEWFKGRRVKE